MGKGVRWQTASLGPLVFCLVSGACSSSAEKACRRIATMCKIDFTSRDIKDCTEGIDGASQLAKEEIGKKLSSCVEDAASCAEAVGCAAGVGVTTFASLEDQFAKGFERSTSSHRRSQPTQPSEADEPRRARPEQPRPTDSDESELARPSVRYLSVAARQGRDAFQSHLLVSIELEVTSKMPFLQPWVNVNALCGAQSDTQRAFHAELDRAQPGDRKFETITLFRTGLVSPSPCEITLTLSKGSTPPARYCFDGGKTTPGRCP